jgi:glyoxylase-like metal-dependent hydrolase (beta-lactamase superfamily II)
LNGWPPHGFNIYLIEAPEIESDPDQREEARGEGSPLVLVDSGTRYSARRILRGVHAQPLAAVLLTHAHPDHQGASAAVCSIRDIPLWCGAGDADAVESGRNDPLVPDKGRNRRLARFLAGPAHNVERRLREGDRIGEWVVLETPGVSPGHISLWRESDRVLIVGDVAINQHPILGRPGLYEQPGLSVGDPVRNAASLRRLADLRPALAVFGHGRPLRDPEALRGLAASAAP